MKLLNWFKRKPKERLYTESEMVSFGNYLLSPERFKSRTDEVNSLEEIIIRSGSVYDADLANWKDSIILADVHISAFSEGDKIAWSTIVNGKVVRLTGDVSSIAGETMCCIGKCVEGNWWRDYVSIHDKSVSKL